MSDGGYCFRPDIYGALALYYGSTPSDEDAKSVEDWWAVQSDEQKAKRPKTKEEAIQYAMRRM